MIKRTVLFAVFLSLISLLGFWIWFATGSAPDVARVLDGDTIELRDGARIRLWAVDAPELGQPGGEQAKLAVVKALQTESGSPRTVELVPANYKSHRRAVAQVLVDGEDLGLNLLNQGWAWLDSRFAGELDADTRNAYKLAQELAHINHRGVWGLPGPPLAPWEWRRKP